MQVKPLKTAIDRSFASGVANRRLFRPAHSPSATLLVGGNPLSASKLRDALFIPRMDPVDRTEQAGAVLQVFHVGHYTGYN